MITRVALKLMVALVIGIQVTANALVAGPATLSGKVKSFDDKKVVLENKDMTYEIPREYIAEKHLKNGEKIETLLSMDQLAKVHMIKGKSKGK